MSAPAPTTADQLVNAALALFGRHGFEATSTRAIATAARTNVSSIAYHFGGKEGLRLACADAVAGQIGQVAQIIPQDAAALSPAEARIVLRRLVRRIATFLTGLPAAADVVGFLLRELAEPGSPVLDRLYAEVVEQRHRALCELWAAATGQRAESEDVKLVVFTLVGQAAYFRFAAPIVQRRMGWDGYPRAASRAVTRRLLANLDAMLGAGNG